MKGRPWAMASAVAVVVTLLFFFLIVRPKLGQIAETRSAIVAAEAEEARLRGEIARLQAIRRDAPATIARLARISQALPSSPALPQFIRSTQAAASRAGVDLQSIAPSQPGPLTGATGIDSINVSLIVEGSYVRIADFLARMENLARVVNVTALSISPEEDPLSARTSLSASMSLTMFVVQPDATLRTSGGGGTTASPSPSPRSS